MSDDWGNRWEFVSPPRWQTLAFLTRHPFLGGVVLLWNPCHWMIGVEIWGWGGSVCLGPLSLAWGALREPSHHYGRTPNPTSQGGSDD